MSLRGPRGTPIRLAAREWPARTMRNSHQHAELSDSVATSLGLSRTEGKKAVDAVFAAIAGAAAMGEEVSVNGFGKFKVKEVGGTRRPQSPNRRDDPDCCFEEARLCGRQGC